MISSETTSAKQPPPEQSPRQNDLEQLMQDIAEIEKEAATVQDVLRDANQKIDDYEKQQLQQGIQLEEKKRQQRVIIHNYRKVQSSILTDLNKKKKQLRQLEIIGQIRRKHELTSRLVALTSELAENVKEYNSKYAFFHKMFLQLAKSQVFDEQYKLDLQYLFKELGDICSKKNQLLEERKKMNQVIQKDRLDLQITITESKIEYSRQRYSKIVQFIKHVAMRHVKEGNIDGQDPQYSQQSNPLKYKSYEKEEGEENVSQKQQSKQNKSSQFKQSKVQQQQLESNHQLKLLEDAVVQKSKQESSQKDLREKKKQEQLAEELREEKLLKQKLQKEQLHKQKEEKHALLLQRQSFIAEIKQRLQSQKAKYEETIQLMKNQLFSFEMMEVKEKLINQLISTHQHLGHSIEQSKQLSYIFQNDSKFKENIAYYQRQAVFLQQVTKQLSDLREYLIEEKQIEQFKQKKRSFYQQILEQPFEKCPQQNFLCYLPEKQFYLEEIQRLKTKMSPQAYLLLKMKQLSLKYQRPLIEIMKNKITIATFDIAQYNNLLQKQIYFIQQLENCNQNADRSSRIEAQLMTINNSLAQIYSENQQQFAKCSNHPAVALRKNNQDYFIQIKRKQLAQIKHNLSILKDNIQSLKRKQQIKSKEMENLIREQRQSQEVSVCQKNRDAIVECQTKDDFSQLLQRQVPKIEITNLQEIIQILQQMKEEKIGLENELQLLSKKRKCLEESLIIEQAKPIILKEAVKKITQVQLQPQNDLVVRLTNEMVQLLNRCKEISSKCRPVKHQPKRPKQTTSK